MIWLKLTYRKTKRVSLMICLVGLRFVLAYNHVRDPDEVQDPLELWMGRPLEGKEERNDGLSWSVC